MTDKGHRDGTYEALASTNASVVYASVTGFVEKKSKFWFPDYLFVLEVYWTSKRTTFIKRSYSDILQMLNQLRSYFSDKFERGQVKAHVFIPNLEGRCAYIEHLLWEFLHQLDYNLCHPS